jgi:hypothetical protein
MNGGWVKMYRSLSEHPLWTGERFTRGQAWADLIMRARYADTIEIRGNRTIEVKRGQWFGTQVELAARWKWNRKTVRAFLNARKVDKMVDIETAKDTDTGYTRVTICNYNYFQGDGSEPLDIGTDIGADTPMAFERTSSGHRVPTLKEGEEGREGKKKRSIADDGASAAVASKKGDGDDRKPRKTHPETQALMTEFITAYNFKISNPYIPSFARDQKILSDLITATSPTDVRTRMKHFFENGTKRTRDTGNYSVPSFRYSFNEIGALMARGDL